MSKEEFMKIQTCVLKVNIHCDGCKSKVKKILQKIDGVFKTTIDAELGKVTVSGNVDHNLLIKKLQKAGKHAELWGAQKPNSNNNQSQLANQLKNMQLDSGKNGTKGQKGGNINPPKGGGGIGGGGGGCGQRNQQQQQVQQMKGFQDLKGPAFKEMKMPLKDQNQKSVKFNLPEDDDLSDFGDDDAEFEDYELEDELDDEFDEPLPPMNKPIMANGRQGIPDNIMMMMMNGNNGGGGGQNGKKGGGGGGGGGSVPTQVNMGNSEGKNGNGGKKGGAAGGGGGGGGNNQNQGGKNGKNGGGFPQNGNNGGGGANNNKNGNNGAGGGGNGNIMNGNASKKGHNGGCGGGGMNDGFQNTGGPVPQGVMPNIKVGQMGNMPMGQMGNIPAVQGLPAAAIAGGAGAGGGGGGGGYFQGAGPDLMPGNPYHQQQYMAAVMNQQRAMGNERFQPMMYARPPPAVNYVPPHPYNPYPYPYPSFVPHPNQPQDPSYTHFFSDENALSCNIM